MSSLYSPTQTLALAKCLLPVHAHGGFVNKREHDLQASARWYVVTQGRKVGVYTNSHDATAQTHKFTKAEMQAFATFAEAEAHWAAHCGANHLPWCPYYYEQNHEDNLVKWGVKGLPDFFESQADALWAARFRKVEPLLMQSGNEVSLKNFVSGV